ncbi:unnamed protein product [Mytilus coruscus]|uniref:EB domain-containing protein n=1 Tax=Mytilus coruscus TaxID=42192 RepID=A0A6J8AT84_MYTCO|nr:unnamed protein product [Mytilus coruscus]
MLPSCNMLLFFLLWITAYGNTLTIRSTVNSTDLDSEIFTEKISNDTCTNSNECGGKLLCEDGVCQCPIDLFWNGSKCIFKHFDGHSCSSSIECAENLECRESRCQCLESQYWENSKCSPKKDEHALCNSSLECKATLQCKTNHCVCCEQDFWNGQFCEKSKNHSRYH